MTVDELKARRKELMARMKEERELQEQGKGDNMAFFMVKEELLDVNAKLRALTPGKRIGSRPGQSHSEFSADRQQFLNWAQGEQDDESDVDARSVMRAAVAEGKDLMSERQWEMFKLWSDGLTMEKISDRLGVNRSTVSRTLCRVKKTLQETVRCREAAGVPLSTSSVLTLDMSQPDILRVVLSCLTEVQAVYLYLYFGEFLSTGEISTLIVRDKSVVSRTLHRGLEAIGRSFGVAQVYLLNMQALGEVAYRFYTEGNVLDTLPLVPIPQQPCWGQETLKQRYHITPEVLTRTASAETAVPECACSTEAAVLQFPTELRAQSVVEMRRGEKQRQHFSKFLTILLEYRRCRHASKTVLLDWLCRIFGAFVGWLGQKR